MSASGTAGSHGGPTTATQSQFARLQGWSKSYVSKLKGEGRVVFAAPGQVDVIATLEKIGATTGAPQRASNSVIGPVFVDARDRKEHYAAELSKLDYLERVGQLMRADEVQEVVHDAITTLRASLQAFPALLAPQLAAINDENAARVLMADHVELLLSDLATTLRALGSGAAKSARP